jgi:probable F420-dependent oxidoreductase
MTAGASPRLTATQVGVALPTNRERLSGGAIRRIVSTLEASPCRSVWVNDHLAAFPVGAEYYPYHSCGRIDWNPNAPQYEALSVCAYVAAATTRLQIGTSVLVLPQRHPIEVSKIVATLADLSDGRFLLGVGVGWSRREMALLGWDPANRGARIDEQLELLKASWNPAVDLATLELEHYSVPADVILEPTPRPGQAPPLLIGGTSTAALNRVRCHGDGWLAVSGPDPEQLDDVGRALVSLRATVDRPLHAVVKIALPIADCRAAVRVVDRIGNHGWQEISFEFGTWNLDDVCGVVDASCTRIGELTHA